MRRPVMDRVGHGPARRTSAPARGQKASATASVLVVVALMLMAPAAFAGDSTGGTAKEGGLGMASAISSLVYGPTKVVYAVGGTTAAGFAWLFSGGDSKVAQTVLTRSVRGTYVITPDHLQGREELEFVGRAPAYREATPQVASAPEAW